MKYLVAMLVAFGTAAFSHSYTVGGLQIMHPYAAATVPGANAGAGYMTITNTGPDDVLIAVDADFARVMMHETAMDGDIVRMQHLDRVTIASGAEVVFEPSGKHIMFMGLNGATFVAGDQIEAVLTFENAGSVDVVFYVEDIGTSVDHSGH